MINRKGQILMESIIFIILNAVFLVILVLFLVRQGTGKSLMEDAYSKQIALLVDAASPGMIMQVNLEDGFKLAQAEKFPFKDVIKIEANRVVVKLSEKSEKEYSFFNNVSVGAYPDNSKNKNGIYVITISKKGALKK